MSSRDNPIFRINEKYESMFDKEKAIADIILNNTEKVMSCSIKDLSNLAGTSESSIVRFCQQLGYKGFSELKIEIAKSFYTLSYYEEIQNNTENQDVLPKKNYEKTIELLKKYENRIDFSKIIDVANMIINSKNILVFGNDSTGFIALSFVENLKNLGIPAFIFSNKSAMKKGCLMMDKNSLNIFITNSGVTKSTVQSAEYAQKNNFNSFAITKSFNTDINKYVKNIIYVPFFQTSIFEYTFQTRITMFMILELIYLEVRMLMQDKNKDSLDDYTNYLLKDAFETW